MFKYLFAICLVPTILMYAREWLAEYRSDPVLRKNTAIEMLIVIIVGAFILVMTIVAMRMGWKGGLTWDERSAVSSRPATLQNKSADSVAILVATILTAGGIIDSRRSLSTDST